MNKEEIYDGEISPLMSQIIAICQKNGIAMLASFDIPTEADPGLRCTSALPDGSGETKPDMRLARETLLGKYLTVGLSLAVH